MLFIGGILGILAYGKHVIVTNIPAHRSVLGDSDFAFWAKQGSPREIAEAVRQAYNKRKDFEYLGSEARKLVLNKYTWAKQANKLKQFLDFVLLNNRADYS